ncbi:MAG: ATP synthase F1 subunit gamma [Candidatus Omnitrophica bacterium]|nr:ATP synthase F1 subunit gamma [Candidatus Omnitrophota bacterium]
MAQSLKSLKDRIRSVENTKKITSAMEMISVAKLNRISDFASSIKPYAESIETILKNLLTSVEALRNPFLEKRTQIKNIAVCVITSDSGLCGSYNMNIIRLAEKFILEKGAGNIKLICVGKRGASYFRSKKTTEIINNFVGFNGRYAPKIFKEISEYLIDIYTKHEVDEVYVVYSHLSTGMVYRPVVDKFLNIEPTKGETIPYMLEPAGPEILEKLIPRFVNIKLNNILLQAFTAEHSARSIAMKSATDNATELLSALILLRNKIRQANITQDMLEIISSSEALKG